MRGLIEFIKVYNKQNIQLATNTHHPYGSYFITVAFGHHLFAHHHLSNREFTLSNLSQRCR